MINLIFSEKALNECLKYSRDDDILIIMKRGWEENTSHPKGLLYEERMKVEELSSLLLSSEKVRSWY